MYVSQYRRKKYLKNVFFYVINLTFKLTLLQSVL